VFVYLHLVTNRDQYL